MVGACLRRKILLLCELSKFVFCCRVKKDWRKFKQHKITPIWDILCSDINFNTYSIQYNTIETFFGDIAIFQISPDFPVHQKKSGWLYIWVVVVVCGLYHSIHPPLLRRGPYKALSHGFCACSGVLKINFYCVQKLGTVHQTADSCTPLHSQAYSPGQQKLLRGNWAPSFWLCSMHSGDVFPTSLDPKDLSLFVRGD